MPRRFVPNDKNCPRCGAMFRTRFAEQRYCSRSCAAKGPRPNRKRQPIQSKVCACGGEFLPKQPRVRFCSRTCVTRYGGTLRERSCRYCGTQFSTKVPAQVFCSHRCQVRARMEKTVRRCLRCGDEYQGFDTRRKYCSRECAYAMMRLGRGQKAHNWRGGRTLWKQHGYVWARAEGHPRSRPKWPYVLEHILVMERAIGRYLLPHERVHHKNGVRTDNRPENLELWKIKDPAGVRAVDYHCAGCTCDGSPVVLLSPFGSWTAA